MSKILKLGDVVRLRSGGPPMTITDIVWRVEIDGTRTVTRAEVSWFSGTEARSDSFAAEALVAASPDE